MSERTSYAAGTPNWVDLSTPDPEAAKAFYGPLFGWSFDGGENPEATGGYLSAMLGEQPVGGVMKIMQEGQPPAWSSYISVEDAEATMAAVKEAGGTVAIEPMDVLDIGRMGFFIDPTGAFCGIWQPLTFKGAGLVNEPGAFSWNELGTRDPDAAKAFYGAVFGWGFEDHDMGDMGTYTEWKLGEDSIGGMMDVTGRLPDEIPAHWLVYFAVENTDAAVEQVKSLGGDVRFGPIDIPAGRFAIVADPFGAVFAVIQTPEEAAA
ncbi:MAG: VOC family protein [Thermoleophilia bacterium]|nr:VOC family protein [Thermoleophilia bacterium]